MRDTQGRTLTGRHHNDDDDPDAFLPSRKPPGELRLLAAVLEDAVHCARGIAAVRHHEQVEARRWLADVADPSPHSLAYMCAHVGVCPHWFSARALSLPWKPLTPTRLEVRSSREGGVLRDLRAGLRYHVIATRWKVSLSTVRSWAYRAGLERRRRYSLTPALRAALR